MHKHCTNLCQRYLNKRLNGSITFLSLCVGLSLLPQMLCKQIISTSNCTGNAFSQHYYSYNAYKCIKWNIRLRKDLTGHNCQHFPFSIIFHVKKIDCMWFSTRPDVPGKINIYEKRNPYLHIAIRNVLIRIIYIKFSLYPATVKRIHVSCNFY